jgi:LPXTG-motif cell wall-anchored protein
VGKLELGVRKGVRGMETKTSGARGSGIAFAAAFVILVVGLFVALGGTAYAQQTPAEDQYKEDVANVFTPPTANEPQDTESNTGVVAEALPNTGLSLLGTALVGGALVAVGLALRRRERKGEV